MNVLKKRKLYKQMHNLTEKCKKIGKRIQRNIFLNNFFKTKPSCFKSNGDEMEYYISNYKIRGLYSSIVELEKNNEHSSNDKKAQKFLSLGKLIFEGFQDKDARFILASISLNLSKSESVLRGYAWACIHSGYYEQAARGIAALVCEATDLNSVEKLKLSLSSRGTIKDIESYIATASRGLSKDAFPKVMSIEFQEYYKLYRQGNDKELAKFIFEKFKHEKNITSLKKLLLKDFKTILGVSDKTTQMLLIYLGKMFSEINRKDNEEALIEEALLIKKNTRSIRAAFWAYRRIGNATKSKECIKWLEDYADKNNDVKTKNFIKKEKLSYLFMQMSSIITLLEETQEKLILNYTPNEKLIAYVLHNMLPYATGGYATRGHGLAMAVQQKGYAIEVVGRPGFPLDRKKELTKSDIVLKEDIDGICYSKILSPLCNETPTFQYIVEAADALLEKFLEIRPAYVIAASNHLTALPALLAARKLNIPFCYEVRGFWEVTRLSREPEFGATDLYKIMCDIECITAQYSDHVFTLTTPMLDELVLRGVSKDKITIIPNSCDPERFIPLTRDLALAEKLNIPEDVMVIGYIGTFVQYEGLDNLAEACGILKKKNIKFRLLLVGNENTIGNDKGPITQQIQDIAKANAFEEWLIMPGRIPHEEVESYYSLIDIAPFPRKPQPVTEMVSPMKPLEAAAMKKAIVVSSVQALVDMITDGENGLVFEKGNIEDLALKLEALLQDESLRIQLGEYARKWVENERTWGRTANILLDQVNLLNPVSRS